MESYKIKKVAEENAHGILKEFLTSKKFIPTFFFSPYTLNMWLTHENKSLYIVTSNEEKILVLHKEEKNNIRILFDKPSEKIIHILVKHFNPRYVAVNESLNRPDENNFFSKTEVEISLNPIANLKDKGIRKKYNQCIRKHPKLVFQPYRQEYVESIKVFLDKWVTASKQRGNKFADNKNDLHFLELYKADPSVVGGVVLDTNEVVSLTLCAPDLQNSLLGIIHKCLRGYTELGVFTYVERAKYLINIGFETLKVGAINNDFKKHFLTDAILREIYCYQLYSHNGLEIEERFLSRIL